MRNRSLSRGRTAGRAWCLLAFSTAILVGAGQFPISAAQAAQASLSWTAPTTFPDGSAITDLAGFKLYAGNAPGSYQQVIDVGNQTGYLMGNLGEGSTYYFAVTAYDTSLSESAFSNEVSKSIPLPPALYQITATAGSGGAITALNNPSVSQASNGSATVTSVPVVQGASQGFTISASAGYHLVDVLVDGASAGPVASYSFAGVAANHTIAASFAATTYSVTPSAGANGSVEPAAVQTVNSGASTSFTISPAPGYQIASVTGCGGTLSGGSYSTGAVTGSCTVTASFSALPGTGSAASNVPKDGILIAAPGKSVPDLADALRALKIVTGTITPTTDDLAHGDLAPLDAAGKPHGDGVFGVNDVVAILRMSVGLL